METITISTLRKNLFEYVEKAERGHVILITHKGKETVKLVPVQDTHWRNQRKHKVELKVPAQEAFAPMEDVFEGYL
ncbi:type II toxin-antitoxin system Phd/YefM family antitoxin [Deltaproteobacteria bacterium TL4]